MPALHTSRAKRNVDLFVVYEHRRYAIELKVPLNGRHPETLFDFCSDIAFIEAMVRQDIADAGFCLLATSDSVFWRDSGRGSAIHDVFRRPGSTLTGAIPKPTGEKSSRVFLERVYYPADGWRDVRATQLMPNARYLLIDVAAGKIVSVI